MTETADPHPSVETSWPSSSSLHEAISLHKAGNLAEAERLYRTVLRIQPDHGEVLRLLGVIHLQRRDAATALELFDRALPTNVSNVALHDNRARALLHLGRHEEALQAYEQALLLAPTRHDVLNNKGHALRGLSRHMEAMRSYNDALLQRPDDIDAAHGRSVCLAALGYEADALAGFFRTLALSPEHGPTLKARNALLSNLDQGSSSGASGTVPSNTPGNDPLVEFVSATRLSAQDFWDKSALGLSLRRMALDAQIVPRIAFENRMGLPEIYNMRLANPQGPDLLVFVHDDVWLDDYFLARHVVDGLEKYDILGVAGNRVRAAHQANWLFLDPKLTHSDARYLSGRVAHGPGPFGKISTFGSLPAECELLDGVLLAVKKTNLNERGVRFDPKFSFHFYDMDLCRTARQNGLCLGTWPLAITHQSEGAFKSQAWLDAYRAYIEKWQD